jgi:GTP cyclohydrolase I-like protein
MKQHQPRGDILRAANSYEHDSNLQKAIEEILQPRGVGVVVEAVHLCMMMRGVEKQSSKTITSALRGQFRECLMTRDEFLRLAHQRVYLSANGLRSVMIFRVYVVQRNRCGRSDYTRTGSPSRAPIAHASASSTRILS